MWHIVVDEFFRAEYVSAIRICPYPVNLQKNAESLQKTEKLEIDVSV